MSDTFPRIVKCPRCGKDKWAFFGRQPGEPEPPCALCQEQRKEEHDE